MKRARIIAYGMAIIALAISGCSTATATAESADTAGPAPESEPTNAAAERGISILGEWGRHGVLKERAYTEHMILTDAGVYTMEATYDDTKEVLASIEESFTFTDTTITFMHKDRTSGTQPYSLDGTGDTLVIGENAASAWTRIK